MADCRKYRFYTSKKPFLSKEYSSNASQLSQHIAYISNECILLCTFYSVCSSCHLQTAGSAACCAWSKCFPRNSHSDIHTSVSSIEVCTSVLVCGLISILLFLYQMYSVFYHCNPLSCSARSYILRHRLTCESVGSCL